MSIRCTQGHENPDEAQYCYECGEPLPSSVPADATNPQDEASGVSPGAAPAEPDEAAAPPPDDSEVPQPAPAIDFEATLPAPDAPAPFAEAPQEAEEAETVTAVPSAPEAEPVAATSAPQAAAVAAHPRLMVEGTTTTFDLMGKALVVIGREDAPSNSFPDFDLTPYGAEEGGVSRLHAQLAQSGDAWTIEDLESTNFTFVNRKRITPKTPTPLNDGDEIRLGRVGLRFKTFA